MRDPDWLITSLALAVILASFSSKAYASSLANACANAIYAKYPDAQLDLATAQVHDGWVQISDIYMKQNRRPYKYRYGEYSLYPWACGINSQRRVTNISRPIDADMH